MSLRWQILLTSVLLAVLPVAIAIVVIGLSVERDFTAQDTRRVETRLQEVFDEMDRRDRQLAGRLDALAEALAADNDFRLAATSGRNDLRSDRLDYAPRQMALMELDVLLILDAGDRVVSSGHFRAAHGQERSRLPDAIGLAPGGRALLEVRTPAEQFLAQIRARPFRLNEETWHLVAGLRLDQAALDAAAPDPDLAVSIILPGEDTDALAEEKSVMSRELELRFSGHIVRRRLLPLVRDGRLADAWILVSHSQGALRQLLDRIQRRMVLILVAAAVLALGLALVLARRISRPLRRLAGRTRDLDLERLDVTFDTGRRDEVGQLARLLDELTGRLRRGVRSLREAEHRATLGEMARQVNHDLRNGLTPLRNVLRHLAEVGRREPHRLPAVLAERQDNLEESLAYLEELATHYARLSPAREPQPVRLDDLCRAVAGQAATADGVRVACRVVPDMPAVLADPVSLRRILDNLVRNALESLPPTGGRVEIRAAVARDEDLDEDRIVVDVADDGEGIAAADHERIFEDFYTTRAGGTGLGLSNVRRLVGDLGGRIRVTSDPGRGTTFSVSLPLGPPSGGASGGTS